MGVSEAKMIPKWMYPLAFAFVIFLIWSDATAAGETAGDFAGFIVDLLGAIGQFLTGLFEGAGEAGSSIDSGTPNPSPTTIVITPAPAADAVDTFTHTHDGITHTHPTVAGN
ncbi:MAG: hypothetical protein ACR2QK_14095 [Acidimicrobiales bacterium]